MNKCSYRDTDGNVKNDEIAEQLISTNNLQDFVV